MKTAPLPASVTIAPIEDVAKVLMKQARGILEEVVKRDEDFLPTVFALIRDTDVSYPKRAFEVAIAGCPRGPEQMHSAAEHFMNNGALWVAAVMDA